MSLFSFGKKPSSKPDFAFPQTVAADAETDLKKAIDANDAHAAINALIRSYVANGLIDPDRFQASIAMATSTAEHFADSPLHGVFNALLARMYCEAYNQNSWVYDNREIPAEPVPADITEWSAEQFKAKISSLTRQSWADPDALKILQTKDFTDIITIDAPSVVFYPTMLDFVYACALDVIDSADIPEISNTDVLNMAIANASTDAARIAWTYNKLEDGNADHQGVRDAFTKYRHSEYSALLLCQYCNMVDSEVEIDDEIQTTDTDQIKVNPDAAWAVESIDSLLKAFPSALLKPNLLNAKQDLLRQSVSITYPSATYGQQPLAVSISASNAPKFTLMVFKVAPPAKNKNSVTAETLKGLNPLTTIEVDLNAEAPFSATATRQFTLPEKGCYVVVPLLSGSPLASISGNERFSISTHYDVVPAIVSLDESNAWLLALEGFNGKPRSEVEAWLGKKSLGKTDAMGAVQFSPYSGTDSYSRAAALLKVDGKAESFTDVTFYFHNRSNRSDAEYIASVLTDRALYHPGDKIHALAVVDYAVTDSAGRVKNTCQRSLPITAVLYDANRQEVDTIPGKTDIYGRTEFEFDTPTDGLTGRFMIQIKHDGKNIGGGSVMVSDYKMPDFELAVSSTERDVPQKGAVTINGTATSYSGMPMAGTKVSLSLRRVSWWRWNSDSHAIYSAEATTDDAGQFTFVLEPQAFEGGDSHCFYTAALEASSATGTTAQASTSFALGKQYSISAAAPGMVDALKPFVPAAQITDCNGASVDIPLLWKITEAADTSAVVAQGHIGESADLSAVKPGKYELTVSAADPELADPDSEQFQIYNLNTDIIPTNSALWVLESGDGIPYAPTVEVTVGTAAEQAWIYYAVASQEGCSSLRMAHVNKGYATLSIDVPASEANVHIVLFTMHLGTIIKTSVIVKPAEKPALQLTGESFRDKLVPGDTETWRFALTYSDGTPARGAVVLDMYNKALEAITAHGLYVRTLQSNFWLSPTFENIYSYSQNASAYGNSQNFDCLTVEMPQFYFYGYSGSGRFYGSGRVMYKAARGMVMAQECSVEMPLGAPPMAANASLAYDLCDSEESEVDGGAVAPEQAAPDAFDYRDADVPMAIWAPSLTTDADGRVEYSFTVPNANTTWRLRAVAWTRSMDTASLMRDFVASKPVMVMPNAPRFLRQGDTAEFSAAVMNNTDSIAQITTTFEVFNPLTGATISSFSFISDVDPGASATLSIPIEADGEMQAIGLRVKATNGQFTDGEQQAIRVLPSMAQLVETYPFYLNPGDKDYSTTLPSAPGARISLTFCENPAWTIVSALPGLREDAVCTANSAAAAIFSAAISRGIVDSNPAIASAIKQWLANPSDSALTSMLEKNEDLKIALLNSTPWVQAAQNQNERMARLAMIFDSKQVASTIAAATEALAALQGPDGGFRWGKWSNESSEWVTSNVLGMMAELRILGWMPEGKRLTQAIDRAVAYWDSCQAKALAQAKKNEEPTDILYAISRPGLPGAIPAGGKKIISNTTADIIKHWKSYADPAYKAMAAEALYLNGYQATSRELLRSVSQFGVVTPAQGLTFPSVSALYDYAILLEAYAMIEPKSPEVDGLRQQLIVRKEANDWGSAVVTTEVVASILRSGSTWTVPAQGATVTAGGETIKPQGAIESATGCLRADLSAHAGQALNIATPGVGPAYGAVYAQFRQQMADVEAQSCPDLSIEKRLTVKRGTAWEYVDEASSPMLKVGDAVRVTLTIHCQRPISFATIVDERPAGLAPADQLPGWMWAEGVGFYRENRDAATNLFVSYMPAGTYVLTYDLYATVSGTFSSGVASIQSQYAPSLAAHSAGSLLTIAPK